MIDDQGPNGPSGERGNAAPAGATGAAGPAASPPPTRDQDVSRLPQTYATALRLREAGADDARIAECLELEVAAVGPLLRLASAKLDHLADGNGA